MSLQTRIESLVLRLAQEFNSVNTKTGALANLTTADKSNLVAAINELKTMVANGIDDASITLTSTYSSSKIVSLLDALKTEILGGADAAYDTLVEIQQYLQNNTSGLDALLAAVNTRVRFDAAQTLTAPEQQQARTNNAVLVLRDAFRAAGANGDRAVVVLTQANLFRDDVRTDLLRPVVQELIDAADRFNGQVVLVNGDTPLPSISEAETAAAGGGEASV